MDTLDLNKFHPNPSKPAFVVPPGSVDAHCHIFGPGDVFPYSPARKYTPGDASKEDLFRLRDFLGLSRNVIVQASCHGTDNTATIDGIKAAGERARGIAVVELDITLDELKAMDAAGIRGVRFAFLKRLVDPTPPERYQRVIELCRQLGWHIVVYFESADLADLAPFIEAIPTTVVVDHMGRPDVKLGIDHPQWKRFLQLLDEHPNIWVKVTGPERISETGPPYDDVVPFGRALVERYPDRVLWGTDWPHPNMETHMPDDGKLVDFIPRVATTKELQQKLLVDNPMRLYWPPRPGSGTRAAFVAGTAAMFAAVPRYAGAQGLAKLRVSGSPDEDIKGTLWGVQSGIFAKYGLDVSVQVANSGAVVTAAVIGGSIDIGKGSLLNLLGAHIRGVPIVLEAPSAIWDTNAPESALVVAKGSPIRTGRDLNGKTISVPSLGDLYQVSISAWVDQHGGDSRTVKFLELPHRAAAESIAAGRVDAANIAPPVLTEAIQSGKVQIIGHAQDAIAKHFITTAYFCMADFAQKNADVMARFRRGLYEAAAYANAHPAEIAPILAKYSGFEEKTVAAMVTTPIGSSPKQLDPRMIQPIIDAAVKYKALPASFPAKDIIDPSALG